ncbi:hypothetical protein CI102_14678, partial [Trichoderma harzianum]
IAAVKEIPLVTILLISRGKSLIFIVLAILAGAGVTIIVAPYTKLKRQLITYCLNVGINCKY